MTSSLLGAAAPSFDEPVEMLDACHGRIQAQLTTLRRLAEWLPAHGADAQAQAAATAILRYFSVAAPHHHADEEEDLFPALLGEVAAGPHAAERPQVEALIARILGEHRHMDAVRDAMMAVLTHIAAGETVPLPTAAVEHFAGLYEAHIVMETAELLPLARRLLPAAVAEQIGRRMAARRGAPTPE